MDIHGHPITTRSSPVPFGEEIAVYCGTEQHLAGVVVNIPAHPKPRKRASMPVVIVPAVLDAICFLVREIGIISDRNGTRHRRLDRAWVIDVPDVATGIKAIADAWLEGILPEPSYRAWRETYTLPDTSSTYEAQMERMPSQQGIERGMNWRHVREHLQVKGGGIARPKFGT